MTERAPIVSVPCHHSSHDRVEIVTVPPPHESGLLKLVAREGIGTSVIILNRDGARAIFNALGVWLHKPEP